MNCNKNIVVRKTASPHKQPAVVRGFSLVEIMVAILLFSIVMLAILKGVFYVRKVAERNVYEATALTLAQGYIEQMGNMKTNYILENPIPTESNEGISDPLIPNIWNSRVVDVNQTTSNTADDIKIEYYPAITNVSTGNAPRIEIVLYYRWEEPDKRGKLAKDKWPTQSIRLIRSYIKR